MGEIVEFPQTRCTSARPEHAGARVIPLRERPLRCSGCGCTAALEDFDAHVADADRTECGCDCHAPPPSCDDCIHAMLGPVTYCTKFREEIIIEELTAAECEEFERG